MYDVLRILYYIYYTYLRSFQIFVFVRLYLYEMK